MVEISSPKHPRGQLIEVWDVEDLVRVMAGKLLLLEGEERYQQLRRSAIESASFFNGFFAFDSLVCSFVDPEAIETPSFEPSSPVEVMPLA